MDTINNLITIYRVYHNTDLLEKYPFEDDGIRYYFNTQNEKWGKYLNEFTLWFTDIIDLSKDYIGFEHYRRTFKQFNQETYKQILESIPQGFCYVYEMNACLIDADGSYLLNVGYGKWHNQLQDYLRENNYTKELENSNTRFLRIFRGMFLMNMSDFKKLYDFVHGVIKYMFKVNNIQSPEDIEKEIETVTYRYEEKDKHRVYAYICEWLIDIWIRSNMKYKQFNMIWK